MSCSIMIYECKAMAKQKWHRVDPCDHLFTHIVEGYFFTGNVTRTQDTFHNLNLQVQLSYSKNKSYTSTTPLPTPHIPCIRILIKRFTADSQ